MTKKKTEREVGPIVKVADAISNGDGGFYRKGDELPVDTPKETLDSLKAKGLI